MNNLAQLQKAEVSLLGAMASGTRGLDVIILSGQSNMSGRGGVHYEPAQGHAIWDKIIPPECIAENNSVLRFSADLHWEEAKEPLHVDIDTAKTCGLGPGLAFATTLLRHLHASEETEITPVIGLVPCAIGSTGMKEWAKGEELYDVMIRRTRAALEQGGQLRAVLWYQGESDTMSGEDVALYQGRLEQMIRNVRSDLQVEDLPFIQVGISWEHHQFPEWLEGIRQAQKAVQVPGVYYVDSLGLELGADFVHLTSRAQVQLGKMLADAYIGNVI